MRRNDIHFKRCAVTRSLIHYKLHILVLACSEFHETELAAGRRPCNHVAMARCNGRTSPVVGLLFRSSEELGIVEYFELHIGLQWSTVLINNVYLGCNDRRIVCGHIDFGVTGCHAQHLLGTIVTAEDICVHEHATRCGCIEPCKVEHRLGFACAKKMPLAVNPSLNPGVVVVGVRPTWSIHLTGRNTHGTQGCHSESRLLATTAIGSAHGCQWRTRTYVARGVCNLLVAPVVDLKHSLAHCKILNPLSQLGIENSTAAVHVLIVHPDRQHKMHELPHRHLFSPRHLGTRLQGIVNVL